MPSESLKILGLRVNNVMAIRAVELQPDGAPVVTVTGRNAQGKSSLLMAIVMALGGKRGMVEEALRQGEKKGEIFIDLGRYQVRRRLTPKDSYLTITADGQELKSPQRLLEELTAAFFDPMVPIRETPRQQAERLRDISGIDFGPLDRERDAVFAERRDVKRDAKNLKTKAEAFPVSSHTERVDTAALMEELDAIRAAKRRNEDIRAEARQAALTLEGAQQRHARLKVELLEAEKAMREAHKEKARADAAVIDLADEDEAPIRQRIHDAAEINRQVDINEQAAKALEEAEGAANRVLDLTQRIADIDDEKARKLAESKLPVKGLSYTEDGVSFKGVPLSQASQAQQIKIWCSLAFAKKPAIRVIIVRDASLLDTGSRATMLKIAQHHDAQVWEEIVNSNDPAAIRIEDGLVVDGGAS